MAHADPAAEWPALAVVLGADLVVASAARGIRRVPAGEFFLGALMTALEPDELIVEVVIPNTETAGALEEVERRPGDFALVGAMACGSRAVVFGAGWRPQRLVELEDLSRSGATDAELRAAAEIVIEAVDDIHASAAYRKRVGAQLIVEVTRRASA